MKLKNTPRPSGNDSYQKPPKGKFLGILQGVCDIGKQPGGKFPARHQVLFRWELHKRTGPSLDEEGKIHTVNANYSATVRGQNSNLRDCLEDHGITVGEDEETDSHDWLGKACLLVLIESESGKSMIVKSTSPFDPEADGMEMPEAMLETNHWEPDDGCEWPAWANFWIERSLDYDKFVKAAQSGKSKNGKPASKPTSSKTSSSKPKSEEEHEENEEDEDIPF